ncbi:hypothetical protein CTI12_AA340110 [Artemisia annua]|uniref:Protein kinase domain-containing protein n=1 Tax=Artemisia annua TaxID=35608 RepID=A0A2U1MTC2_ARTAN|nr:hypothetical protein CTI12_AA340110 [Artemisia annua]
MKLGFDDPDGFFHSWTGDDSPCSWTGVTCSEPGSTGSVVSVDLSNANIAGPFPVVLCMLNEIKFISFFNNSVNGSLSDELTSCRKLEHLNLAQNYLTGELPESLPELTELKVLDLTGNNFSGEIPASYGRFQSLEVISLVDNLISGKIPAVVGNITTLKQLNLSYNPFTAGEIPAEIGRLKNLEVLWLTGCNLIGPIPDSLSQLGQLVDLDLAINKLTGSIPSSLTELRNVVQIELYNNSLTGELPKMGWSKMTSLRLLDVSMNLLTGNVPEELCSLQLESLNLYENEFVGKFPDIISNSSNLYELRVFGNRFTGELPESLGKNSPLTWVDVSNNMFSGRIPGSLCDKGVLEEVLMIHNSFSGEIPGSFSKCRSLKRVRLGYNKLSGEVPVGFWGLPQVSLLELVENSLSGGIGKTIAGAGNLSTLNIAHNKFSGELPDEIGFLDSLNEFSGSNNMFSGSLPASIVNLEQLTKLDLHNNGNQFSGKIPVGLQNLRLNQLNLSSNSLTGDIPPVYAKKMYITSFLGNPGLCGDIEGLCDGKNVTRNVGYIWLLRSIFVLTGCILIVGVGWFFWRYKNFKKSKDSIDKSKWTLMSFHKLSFSEYEILGALDEDNVIGSGSSGKVYRVVLSNGDAVAVKKLWSSSKKGDDEDLENGSVSTSVLDNGFEAEVETLGKIRHKNIVRLWCCCSTRTFVDGNEKGGNSMSVIAGSCGYIAPEYAYTLRVNEKSDIYSFGVVILELVTGKLPVDPEFGEKDLVKWVCTTLDQKGVDVVLDPKLDSCFKEEICKVLNVGLLCTSPLPINRPSMRRVVKMLQEIGSVNPMRFVSKDGKLTPYYYDDASDHGSVA